MRVISGEDSEVEITAGLVVKIKVVSGGMSGSSPAIRTYSKARFFRIGISRTNLSASEIPRSSRRHHSCQRRGLFDADEKARYAFGECPY